jgi:hypothetical protein
MHQVDRAMASANTLLQPNGPLVANLNKAGSAAEQVGVALNDLNARVQYDTLPRFNALAGSVGDASRQLKDVAGELGRNPSSLLFGSPGPAPGPASGLRLAGYDGREVARRHALPPAVTRRRRGRRRSAGRDARATTSSKPETSCRNMPCHESSNARCARPRPRSRC